MERYTTDRIRNVAVVGHSGVGKTTLVEAILHRAGVTTRAGSVDDGTTVTDTDPDEIARKMTISLGLAPVEWRATDGHTYKINLLDTPGYPDFSAEIDTALAVADLAVVVVSAVDGVEIGTEQLWRRCEELGIPRLVFVTREDKQRADFRTVLAALRARFGDTVTPLELPLGEEAELHGVADLLSEEALEYEADGTHHSESLPAELADEEHRAHETVVEEIVSSDDEQLERYLSGDEPSVAELERTLAAAVLTCAEFPVLLGSGTSAVGVDRLADLICELGPSPADRPVRVLAGDTDVDVPADPAADPLAVVIKTVADQYVGQLSVFKVVSGTIRDDDRLVDVPTGTEEKLHGLFHLRGTQQLPATEVVAGDLAAVPKLTAARTGSTLAPKGRPVTVPTPTPPQAVYALALTPVTQSDDDKLSGALARLVAEDPSLRVDTDPAARQTVLHGTGDVHLAVALSRLERKYGVKVTTADVKIAYRETITGTAEAQGRLKKQSGGHGQFAVVDLRVAPAPRGTGLEFVDAIVGGAIPKQYVAASQKGVEDAMQTGGALGFPVVDIRVECYDGKTHAVDSSDMAFRTAAASGLREALAAAHPVVLEPIARIEVTVPPELQGDVLGDVSSRRGRVVSSDTIGPDQVIVAEVPAAEVQRYAIDLRSLTGGRGRFVIAHSHYDVLPDHLVAAVRAAQQAG
jgi:elongation factor G